jgi:hypothetical protein
MEPFMNLVVRRWHERAPGKSDKPYAQDFKALPKGEYAFDEALKALLWILSTYAPTDRKTYGVPDAYAQAALAEAYEAKTGRPGTHSLLSWKLHKPQPSSEPEYTPAQIARLRRGMRGEAAGRKR